MLKELEVNKQYLNQKEELVKITAIGVNHILSIRNGREDITPVSHAKSSWNIPKKFEELNLSEIEVRLLRIEDKLFSTVKSPIQVRCDLIRWSNLYQRSLEITNSSKDNDSIKEAHINSILFAFKTKSSKHKVRMVDGEMVDGEEEFSTGYYFEGKEVFTLLESIINDLMN